MEVVGVDIQKDLSNSRKIRLDQSIILLMLIS